MTQLRVLVVDDEPGMRSGVERVLGRYAVDLAEAGGRVSFAVETAESGERALELIAAQPPDIVLLDHKLPGISGIEVLERLEGHLERTLVIMITAYASLEAAVTATKRGAWDFLAKPFTPQELQTVLRKAAGRILLQRRAAELAEERRRVRFEFIRVLGHELKSPLGAIEGYLNIMQVRTLGTDLQAYVPMVDRCLVRIGQMRKLIVDLLDMTRIESGQMRREIVTVDLREVASAAIEGVMGASLERRIRIDLDAPQPVPLRADRIEMEILLNNLVSNAIKYNRDEGSVTVTLRRDAAAAHLVVSDTGIGMNPEEVSRLFGEFVRIKNPRTRNVLGSGLGLSIVKRIVQLYDGDIRVDSTSEVGTTFHVLLKPARETSQGGSPTA